jgi:hypothetical protein
MKRLAYFLILLLISAQVDDAWVVAADVPSTPLVEDGDEYLPAQRPPQEELFSSSQGARFVRLTVPAMNFSVVRRNLPPSWNLAAPFTAPPLYAFMSMQI